MAGAGRLTYFTNIERLEVNGAGGADKVPNGQNNANDGKNHGSNGTLDPATLANALGGAGPLHALGHAGEIGFIELGHGGAGGGGGGARGDIAAAVGPDGHQPIGDIAAVEEQHTLVEQGRTGGVGTAVHDPPEFLSGGRVI